ncbi:NUMOD3 domain-containing DNA-binding protein [Bacillus sp. FJAT-50079]|uniref:NUMOD3 domain-containing DNA-binding protein n=1 Tax=Bacillus sp. FJAT-50079 TaxID=2833577 RepID=UPI001BC91F6D|nr:NUMOD3 domain-containing DNA-binding protein [Bacillus sp. FJAT-50079]MBS4206723.1 hypothetical protein [Bacillus sp. FJAT-50079]
MFENIEEEKTHGLKGRRLTEEHKRKLSEAKLGKKRPDYTRAKIKRTMLGNVKEFRKKEHQLVDKTGRSRSHLTGADVKEIRDRYSNEQATSIRQLAAEYGVSRHTIHTIVTYKYWK